MGVAKNPVTKMATLRRVKPLFTQACVKNALFSRHISKARPLLAQWHEDWEVGKKPVTKEEREAAAKKYGLIPEDYEPTTDTSDTSDYPMLPRVGHRSLDPYADWDDPGMKRNFGEPVHRDWEQLTEDRADPAWEYKFTYWKMFGMFCTLVGGLAFLTMALEPYRYQHPRLEKQYPWDDIKRKREYPRITHYTFEPAE